MLKYNAKEILAKIDELVSTFKPVNKLVALLSANPDRSNAAKIVQQLLKLKKTVLAQDVKEVIFNVDDLLTNTNKSGSYVKLRYCKDDKTYFGIYIGELAMRHAIGIHPDKIEISCSGNNPAIWVPDLKKIVYGMESWWDFINSEEDAKELITNKDIDNIWYVKLLKQLN